MATPELAVLDGGKPFYSKTKAEVGSKNWSEAIRKETKELCGDIERNYMLLARNLWLIFDTPIDGDRKNNAWWTKWGYNYVTEYEEQELGINKRRAERLRRVWAVLGVDLKDCSEEVRQRIIDLGFSKVRELTRIGVLTPANVESWLDKAEKLTYIGVRDEVKMFLSGRDGVMKGSLGKIEPVDDDGDVDEPEPDADSAPPPLFPKSKKQTIKDAVSDAVQDAPKSEIPEEEKLHYKTFAFYDDQWDTVNAAMERAQQISGSKVDSHNMSLICLDYLATNDFKTGPEQMQRWLIRAEKALGVKLVALNKENEILYGYKTFDKILKSGD